MAAQQSPRPFHAVLRGLREGRQMSMKELAERTRVPQSVIHDWERGKSLPDRKQYNRIVGVFQQLRYYESSFPTSMTGKEEEVRSPRRVVLDAPLPAPAPDPTRLLTVKLSDVTGPLVQDTTPPKVFGEELRRLREKDGYSAEEVGYTIGAVASTVRKWETGAAVPTKQYYDQLLEFFPELAAVPIEGVKDGAGIGRPRKTITLATGHAPDDLAELRVALEHNAKPEEEVVEAALPTFHAVEVRPREKEAMEPQSRVESLSSKAIQSKEDRKEFFRNALKAKTSVPKEVLDAVRTLERFKDKPPMPVQTFMRVALSQGYTEDEVYDLLLEEDE